MFKSSVTLVLVIAVAPPDLRFWLIAGVCAFAAFILVLFWRLKKQFIDEMRHELRRLFKRSR